MGRNALFLMAFGALSLSVTGCSSMGKAMGVGKNPPDEFAIVTKAPLTVPPDYALRPPKPGETRPERQSTSERTRQLLLGDETSAPPSRGELALMQQIDALEVDPNIRAVLAAENGGRADKDDSFANQIIFWRVKDNHIDDTNAPLRVDDREAWEADRMEQIETVTGGKTVSISNEDARILNLPGVK